MSTEIPKKPSDAVLWLYTATVTKLSLSRRWSAPDGSDEKTTITFLDEFKKEEQVMEASEANAVLDFRPNYCSLCRLKEHHSEVARAWLLFSKNNAEKIELFNKLKAELGLP